MPLSRTLALPAVLRRAAGSTGRRRPFLRNSLFVRVMTANLVLAAGLAAVLTAMFVVGERAALQQQLQLRAKALAELIAAQAEYPLVVHHGIEVAHLARNAVTNEDLLFVHINSCSGAIDLAVSRPGLEDLIPASVDCGRLAASGRVAAVHKQNRARFLELSIPIHVRGQAARQQWKDGGSASPEIGVVTVGLSAEQQHAIYVGAIKNAVSVAFVSILFMLMVLDLQLRKLSVPLKRLMRFARRVGTGDFTQPAPSDSLDEVGQLAAAFNEMLARLGATTVSRDYVDNILRSIGEALLVVDQTGKISRVNTALLLMLGYREEDLLGTSPKCIMPSWDSNAGGTPERIWVAKDGREIPVLFSEAPLCDHLGRAHGAVWVAQDVTGQKRVQRELLEAKDAAERASNVKSMFLANVSHELRTPLNAIINYAEMMIEDCAESGNRSMVPDLQKIARSARRLLGVINDVLDLSKIEAGKMQLHLERFDVQTVIREVVDSVRPLSETNGNIVEVDSPEGLELYADSSRFHQSLLNLAGNACKFTSNGKIRIRVLDETDWVRVDVHDTGIGIPSEQLSKLFQPFVQADAPNTRRFAGTGLGLAISRELCRMMGGDITAHSVPGQGSTFSLSLPRKVTLESGSGNG
jgi:PAS domain S-box-containing protein